VEVRPVEVRDPALLEVALFLEAPDTAALTVWETRGEIWETIWAIRSAWDVLEDVEVDVVAVGRGAGALTGAGVAAGRRDPETAEETVWEIRG